MIPSMPLRRPLSDVTNSLELPTNLKLVERPLMSICLMKWLLILKTKRRSVLPNRKIEEGEKRPYRKAGQKLSIFVCQLRHFSFVFRIARYLLPLAFCRSNVMGTAVPMPSKYDNKFIVIATCLCVHE
jgi:hypothetical protein